MINRVRVFTLLDGIILAAFAACAGAAAPQRTFVSANGNDANPCSLTLPCRGFAAAVAAVTTGGEVVVLDSSGYGPFTIDRSVSVVAPAGVYAGISVPTGNGVTIGTAAVDVVLKGLTINGIGGANGILMTNGASLRIENCALTGFISISTAAINISAAAKLNISNTLVANSNAGVVLDGGASADVSRLRAVNNATFGILIGGTSNAVTTAVVSDSVVSGSGSYGVAVLGQGANGAGGFGACTTCSREMTLVNSDVSNNAFGVASIGNAATVNVARSTISSNGGTGLEQAVAGSVLRSAQNNVVTNNGLPTSGTISTGGIIY